MHLNALTIAVTAFDNATHPTLADKFAAQATLNGISLQACLNSPACVDFEPYGLTDRGVAPIFERASTHSSRT